MLSVRRDRSGEQGAVALLVSIAMVGLCVASAMVIDLGLLRVDRQENKSAQDSAAMAGVNGLVPSIDAAGSFHPFAGVCQAVNYLKVNDDRFSGFSSSTWNTGTGGAIAGAADGCDPTHAADICTPNDPSTWARWTGVTTDGKSTVVIQSGYKVKPPSAPIDATYGDIAAVTGGDFAEDGLSAYSADEGATTNGGCDQVAVIIGETRSTTLGSPAASTMGTRVRSVARVRIDPPQSPYALLILERTDCQVLTNGNNGVAAINVDGYKTHPGLIHSDSDGKGANCNKQVIVGQKSDGVVAHEAPDNQAPGSISTVATSNQSDGLTNVYAGPAASKTGPTSSGQVTRSVVDAIYLDGVRSAVASSSFAWSAAAGSGTLPADSVGSSPGPWTKINSCAAAAGTITDTKVLVMCNSVNANATFTNATDIIFAGSLGGGSANIRMPKAQNVYVVGSGQPNGVGVDSGAQLSMHDNGAACSSLFDSAAGRAKLVVYGGSLTATGGIFRACNTSVILMGNDPSACLPPDTPSYYIDGKVCNSLSKTGNGIVNMGGNATVDWTAPNIKDDEFQATKADHDALEDLALWAESYGTQGLGGSGTVHLAGVFVAPNAKPLKLNGTPTWQVLNSQYVVRTLENDGGAIFNMRPSPALPVSPPTVSFYLVR